MSVKTLVYPVLAVQVSPPAGGATSANQVLEIAELTDINTELDAQSVILTDLLTSAQASEASLAVLEANSSLSVVDQIDTTPLLDTSFSNIPASASSPLEIVASLAADVKKILSVEDIGEYIGVYTGAALSEVLVAVLPLGGGEVDIEIPAATRVSLRAMENSAISTGKIAINFIG